jgi:hypothetical protein
VWEKLQKRVMARNHAPSYLGPEAKEQFKMDLTWPLEEIKARGGKTVVKVVSTPEF